MSQEDRADRHLRWFRNHPIFSVVFVVATILALLAPLQNAASSLWAMIFGPAPAGLRVVDIRVVEDPWEAGRLRRPWFPELADSAKWLSSSPVDSSDLAAMGGRLAEMRDSLPVVWFPNFAQFPELALLDILVRNTAPQSAVIRRIELLAVTIRPSDTGIACLPLDMSAAYHIALDGSKERQTVSAPLAHRIGGNDAERFGLLIGLKDPAGGVYRLHLKLRYNEDEELHLPPVEVKLSEGCGSLGSQVNKPLRLPPS